MIIQWLTVLIVALDALQVALGVYVAAGSSGWAMGAFGATIAAIGGFGLGKEAYR